MKLPQTVATGAAASGRVLSVRKSLMAMLGLCFVIMLVAIDQTVVGTALPTIVAELNGFELYAWVATSYLLTSVITIPIFGRLGDYYGRQPFVVASIIVFTLASVLCGMSNTMLQLVLARALQGVGGGMLVGTVFACVPDLFPDSHVRLRWQVLLSAAFGIANAVGPSLGGMLTQYAGWRSVFYVNVPIGLMSLYFVWCYLPRIRQIQAGYIHLDWQGALLIALGLGSLQIFVELLPAYGANFLMMALGITSAGSFVVLFYWERRCPNPLLPLGIFRNKSLAALFCLSLFVGFIMFVLLFYAPLLLQAGFGMTPQAAGVLITPLVLCITVGSITNARVITRIRNPNYMLYSGYALLGLSCLGIMSASRETSDGLWVLYMALGGTGLGFVMPNLTVYAQEAAGRSLLGIATAMLQSVRMIGGMLGMAIVGALVTHYYARGVRDIVSTGNTAAWAQPLQDPQILMSAAAEKEFLTHLQLLGHDGTAVMDVARESLSVAIQMGMIATLLMAVLGLIWVRRVPPIRFTRVAVSEPSARE